MHGVTNVGDMPARLLGTVTLGGLHEKMPTEIGEQARTETLPTPPEGRSDMADMERIMETALKYGTQPLPPSEWWARQELRKLLLEKGAGVKTPAPSLPYSCHKRDGNSCPLTCWHVPCWRGFLASVTPMGNFSAAKGDSSRCYGTPRKRVGGADSHAALLSVPDDHCFVNIEKALGSVCQGSAPMGGEIERRDEWRG